mmetsp:Transcript_30313/g.65346  ORF Transcript_30313/g.65346 Transcript_30313/m.65346 type:complete len:200 (+) Transcript_30313:787-1386(+)
MMPLLPMLCSTGALKQSRTQPPFQPHCLSGRPSTPLNTCRLGLSLLTNSKGSLWKKLSRTSIIHTRLKRLRSSGCCWKCWWKSCQRRVEGWYLRRKAGSSEDTSKPTRVMSCSFAISWCCCGMGVFTNTMTLAVDTLLSDLQKTAKFLGSVSCAMPSTRSVDAADGPTGESDPAEALRWSVTGVGTTSTAAAMDSSSGS